MIVPTPTLDRALRAVADALAAARGVVVLTGAGASAESGIPTFRDTMAGLWKDFDPQTLATPQAFARDPATVSRWYDHRRIGCLAAKPNRAHLALAELERRVVARGGSFLLLTQNVDGLHQRAGSRNVQELHGSIMVWRCTRTGREVRPPDEPMTEFPPRSPFAEGAVLRPGVVWFGELLPPGPIEAADRAMPGCDVFLSVGTSAVVYPAAGFIEVARAHGARTIEVNPEATEFSPRVRHSLRGRAGDILPRLLGEPPPGSAENPPAA